MTRSHNIFNYSHDYSSVTIPEGLVGRVRLTLCSPHDDNQSILHHTAYGLVYLQGVFTLINGQYAGRTIEQIIAVAINDQAAQCSYAQHRTLDSWITSGRLLMQQLLSSAQRSDLQESYQEHLKHKTLFDYKQLDGLDCAIMVGEGIYPPHRTLNKSEVAHIFVPPHHFHGEAMEQNLEIRAYPYPHSPYETHSLFRDDILIASAPYYPCLRSA